MSSLWKADANPGRTNEGRLEYQSRAAAMKIWGFSSTQKPKLTIQLLTSLEWTQLCS